MPSESEGTFDVGDAYGGLTSGGDGVQAAVGKGVAMAYHTQREAILTTQCRILSQEQATPDKHPRARVDLHSCYILESMVL